MVKHSQIKTTAQKSQKESERIARGIQKPGQRKEQTKLIAQGIQKGIEMYKAEQSAKSREADKQRKRALKQKQSDDTHESKKEYTVVYKQHWLPWLLLALSWIGFSLFLSQR